MLIIGVAIAALGIVLISLNADLRRDPFTTPLIISIMAAACLGFLLRQRRRMLYSLIELMVGLLLTIYAVIGDRTVLHDIFIVNLPGIILHLRWASFLSGVYFTIRALDNMGKALKSSQRLAVEYNFVIDRDWHHLVTLEAERLWRKKGCLSTTEVEDWEEAQLIIHRTKRTTPEADLWERVFGFD